MRFVLPIMFAVGLASCGNEPSFDERFDQTSNDIEQRANEIDNELAAENSATDQ